MKVRKLLPLLMAAVLGVSALAGCGNSIDADKVGATLDGQEISLGFMNFMARYQQILGARSCLNRAQMLRRP